MSPGAARRGVAIGAVLTAVGLLIAATAPVAAVDAGPAAQTRDFVAGVVVVSGWLVFAWAIHRLGREG